MLFTHESSKRTQIRGRLDGSFYGEKQSGNVEISFDYFKTCFRASPGKILAKRLDSGEMSLDVTSFPMKIHNFTGEHCIAPQ